ncbi:hypothetical protein V8E54_007115 [Elaphomyces granulatus]
MPATKDYVTDSLPIRTAELLGTPSKTLRSGTPGFVRGSRQFYVTLSVLARTQSSLHTFYQTFSEMAKPSPHRLMRGQECQTSTQSIGQGLRCPDGNDFGAEMHLLH